MLNLRNSGNYFRRIREFTKTGNELSVEIMPNRQCSHSDISDPFTKNLS